MFFSRKKKEERNISDTMSLNDLLILMDNNDEDFINKEKAINIPALSGCIELISNTIASLTINLFKETNGEVIKVQNDIRTKLLNDDTCDTLNGYEFKKAVIVDYLLLGNAYIYINKDRHGIKSLNYVKEECVNININSDPIFKHYNILVNGKVYDDFEFIKILRNTKNGATGYGIIEENPKILATAYNYLSYENRIAKAGGSKKGIIKSKTKLKKDAIDFLKLQWNKMYSDGKENCIVLNDGLEFQESSSTNVELQLNENKAANNDDICKICNVPPNILNSTNVDVNDYELFIKICILPILTNVETALNRDLLFQREKGSFYFAFDTTELLKGNIEQRYKAYEIAIKNKLLTINEIRYAENKQPIEAFEDTIVLGLNDVLYNTKKEEIFIPNIGKEPINLKKINGSEIDGF